MKRGSINVLLGFFLASVAWTHAACQQPPAQPAGDLQQQVTALRQQVSAMQKDLDEIKALLAPLRERQAPRVPTNATLDLGNRPVKGAPSAKVTLVELTDYQ
jgi:protein-disulfide isomerase